MRQWKKIIGICLGLLILIAGLFLLHVNRLYVVPIMMYHHVEDLDHHEANWVSPKNFEFQMAFLKKHRYHVISLEKLVEITRNNEIPRWKTVVITFDDGYVDNYTEAVPILKKYGFPAIFFLPVNRMGTPGHMSWNQVRELAGDGFAIGSHGLEGRYLLDFSREKQIREIKNSRRNLENRLGQTIDYFAYPIGGFSDFIKSIVAQSGYQGACATNRGFDRFNKDVFELNRIRFSNQDSQTIILWAKLSGFYNFFRKNKKPY